MRPGKEMLLYIPLIFILTSGGVNSQNATEENQVTETPLTSADCLAYVYVTWIFFVYSIGLGAEERDYPQVLSRAYALVPSQCGGYFTSSPVIPPATMLSLLISTISPMIPPATMLSLLISTMLTTTTSTMAPSLFNLFPSLFLGNGARGGLTSLDSVRGGVGRKKRMRKSRDSVFKEGMNKMAGQPLTKYIAQLGRPLFKTDGSIELDLNKIKGRKGRRFCRDLARSMSMKDVKKICKRIKKMRKMGQKGTRGSRKQGKWETRKGKKQRAKGPKEKEKKN